MNLPTITFLVLGFLSVPSEASYRNWGLSGSWTRQCDHYDTCESCLADRNCFYNIWGSGYCYMPTSFPKEFDIMDSAKCPTADCLVEQVGPDACTRACGTVYGSRVIRPPKEGGAPCQDTTYECQPGDHACPDANGNTDCIVRQATKYDCTDACGTVTVYDALVDQYGDGAPCVGTTYACKPGDGACPHVASQWSGHYWADEIISTSTPVKLLYFLSVVGGISVVHLAYKACKARMKTEYNDLQSCNDEL